MNKISVLVLSDGSTWGNVALNYAEKIGFETTYISWNHGETLPPEGLDGWHGDWILSFKSDYVLSAKELSQAKVGALNFHPAPPDLRGIGTYQIALEEKRARYGVTCHYMAEEIDAGPIVATRYFDIPPAANPLIVQQFAAAHLYFLYIEILGRIKDGDALPLSTEKWSGSLHTWKQFKQRHAGEMLSP